MALKDIGNLKDTVTVTLRHPDPRQKLTPNADGTPMTVTVYGPHSSHYKAILREQQQRRVEAGVSADALGILSVEEVEDMNEEALRRCIVDWDLTLEGEEKFPFTPENVEVLFAEVNWVVDQLYAAWGNTAGFLAPSKKH
jgi:hypothetical protein